MVHVENRKQMIELSRKKIATGFVKGQCRLELQIIFVIEGYRSSAERWLSEAQADFMDV